MNSKQLKDRLKNILKEKSVDFNTLLRLYMYDRFIVRLSKSKYKSNFIIKGGFYLTTLFGVENRTTMDIDAAIRNIDFDKETIVRMIKEILSIKIDDDIELSYISISSIRNEDKYGGFRVDILSKLDNVKEKFHIDVATGDPITPKEIRYKYMPLLGKEYINIYAYNIETVIAEKIETILSRGEINGRMRDYYDIYLIYTKDWNSINKKYFNDAILKTFANRNYKGNPFDVINDIKNSNSIRLRWTKYQDKYDYAKEINFDDILECIKIMLEHLIL